MKKYLRRLSLTLTLVVLLLIAIVPARADVAISMQLDVDKPTTVIGRTVIATARLVNSGTHTLKVNSLNCPLTGSSIVQTSSYGQPDINPGATVLINIYYRAVAAGTTRIECTLNVTDKVTGEQKSGGTSNEVLVIGETRLFYTVYSATQYATVGQSVYVIDKFGNRGNTAFTNVAISCMVFGDALVIASKPPAPPTLQPGQATFVESRWLAVHPGRTRIDCSISGTDSTGTIITVPAPPVIIEVR